MLLLPTDSDKIKIMSFDPGTSTAGVSMFEFNLSTKETMLVDAFTLKASTTSLDYKFYSLHHGDRLARITSIIESISEHMNAFKPNITVSEASYMGLYVDAFEGLIHFLSLLELAVIRFNQYIPLELIDPTSVKRNIGAVLRGENKKDSVKEQVIKRSLNNDFTSLIDLTLLDEHAIDSVAVGIWKIDQIKGYIG